MTNQPQQQFEVVLFEGGYRIDRLAVPGGWIYRDQRMGAMVFVPFGPPTLADLKENYDRATGQAGA